MYAGPTFRVAEIRGLPHKEGFEIAYWPRSNRGLPTPSIGLTEMARTLKAHVTLISLFGFVMVARVISVKSVDRRLNGDSD